MQSTPDLKFHENLLVAICGSLAMGLLVYDADNTIIFANSQIRDYVDIPEESLLPGKPLREALLQTFDSKRRLNGVDDYSRPSLDRDTWVQERLKIHSRDWYDQVERLGRGRWVRFICRRTLSGMGITMILDVTDAKRQEGNWHADMERIKLTEEILDSLPVPLFVKNRNLSYVAVNRAFCNMHAVTPDAVLGRSVWDLVDSEIAEQIENEDRIVLESGVPLETREILNTPVKMGQQVLTRKHRIGKPGHYMLVTVMDEISGRVGQDAAVGVASDADPADLYQINLSKPEAQTTNKPDLRHPVRILVLFEDLTAGNLLSGLLSRTGVEACAVSRPAELRQFLELATTAGMKVSMLVTDRYSINECRDTLDQYTLSSLVVEDPVHHAQILGAIRDALKPDAETKAKLGAGNLHAASRNIVTY